VGRFRIRSWNQAGLKKKQEKKKLGVTRRVDLARSGQKPGCNPLTLFFILKQHSFDLKKKN